MVAPFMSPVRSYLSTWRDPHHVTTVPMWTLRRGFGLTVREPIDLWQPRVCSAWYVPVRVGDTGECLALS